MQNSLNTALQVDDLAPARSSLRIAMVSETYPPEVNGVANTVACLVEGLRTRNHAVQLIRPRQDRDDQGLQSDRLQDVLTRGLPIPGYGHLRMGLPSKRALLRLWTARRPDLVHIATEGPLGWSALQAALKLKLPVCSDFRTNFHAYSQFYRIGWLQKPITAYLRKFHNRCHCTMVPTESLREQLDKAGFGPLAVVARGVDTALFSPHKRSASLRAQWGVGESDLVVLHVGRLAAEKNLPVLAKAFARIQCQQPNARLLVVGDGPSRQELQAQCPGAIFVGFRHGEDLAAHYASSDMFIFPSLTETYGNVTPEAMASGLAVLAFDDAAAAELIDHQHNGMLAPKGDAAAFFQLAVELASHPRQRLAMGSQARLVALDLGWESIVRKMEGVYTQAMQQAESPLLEPQWAQLQRS